MVLRLRWEHPLQGGENQRALVILVFRCSELRAILPGALRAIVPIEHAVMKTPTAGAVLRALEAAAIAFAETPPAFEARAMRTQHMRKHDEPALLRIVKALIERRTGFGHFLQRSASLRHIVGAARQPVERRHLLLRLLLIGSFTRLDAIDAQLRHVAHGLFESGPVLGLVGCELKAGFHGRDPRISEGRNVGCAWTMVKFSSELGTLRAGIKAAAVGTTRALLRIDQTRTSDSEQCRRGDDRL